MTIVIMILKFLWTMAKKIPWQVYACAGVGICFWLWGTWQYQQGQKETQDRWDAAVKQGKARIEQLKEKQLTVNMIVDTVSKEKVKTIYVTGKTIIKEIPVYIPADTPDLPAGFRVLHDAAATNTLPSWTGVLPTDTVPVATATETITLNYQECHLLRQEVDDWRLWHKLQTEAHAKLSQH